MDYITFYVEMKKKVDILVNHIATCRCVDCPAFTKYCEWQEDNKGFWCFGPIGAPQNKENCIQTIHKWLDQEVESLK